MQEVTRRLVEQFQRLISFDRCAPRWNTKSLTKGRCFMTDAKMQLVQSWLIKAQHDLTSARVLAAHTPPLLETAIYIIENPASDSVSGQ